MLHAGPLAQIFPCLKFYSILEDANNYSLINEIRSQKTLKEGYTGEVVQDFSVPSTYIGELREIEECGIYHINWPNLSFKHFTTLFFLDRTFFF
jgi:hypothetical protein